VPFLCAQVEALASSGPHISFGGQRYGIIAIDKSLPDSAFSANAQDPGIHRINMVNKALAQNLRSFGKPFCFGVASPAMQEATPHVYIAQERNRIMPMLPASNL